MSDLTMCCTEGCPSEALCWRKQAPVSTFQSYSLFEIPSGESRCEFFWPFLSKERQEEISRVEALNRLRDDEITIPDQSVS